jgi:glycerol-3-phosphate dehydrogenase
MPYQPDSSRLQKLSPRTFDIAVIGGGATGAGIALDAAKRGFSTLLVEQADFGKGTSSRSTKLLHGGVRYLAQGDVTLVMEALQERGYILKNAPHLTGNQEFVIPVYTLWDVLKYTIGLKLYDILAGRLSLGRSRYITVSSTVARLPLLKRRGLKGGIVYHDGQFDDSRLLVCLVRAFRERGGEALNYCRANGLLKTPEGKVCGIRVTDLENHEEAEIRAGVVFNATGVFVDELLKLDHPVMKRTIRPSQGIHLVFNRSFLGGNAALMIPKTDDGRVLFAIPWYDRVVAGTTDTPLDVISLEPRALESEIDFVLRTAGLYLSPAPTRRDIQCVFAGLRPLAANPDDPTNTREISRRHKITVSATGLVTVEGGKWTIYRRMAEDALDKAMRKGLLERRSCETRHFALYHMKEGEKADRLRIYGSGADAIRKLIAGRPETGRPLHERLPYTEAEIRWICRNEFVLHLEDVLARRTRALFLDAAASLEMAETVAMVMAAELGKDPAWREQEVREYRETAGGYLVKGE